MGHRQKSKHKQPDQKYCQYNRINICLEKGLPDSAKEMYITFACLVDLIEYMLKKLRNAKKVGPYLSFAVRHLGRHDPFPTDFSFSQGLSKHTVLIVWRIILFWRRIIPNCQYILIFSTESTHKN